MIEGRGLGGLTEAPPRKPLIAAVEGWALAGGFEIVLACDLVVAAETARFGVPEVKRALVAGAGAALLLTQRIPRTIALELLLTGDPIDAARAAALGLVNRLTPEGGALDGALELAATIAAQRTARRRGDQADRDVVGRLDHGGGLAAPVRADDAGLRLRRTPRRARPRSPRSAPRSGRAGEPAASVVEEAR